MRDQDCVAFLQWCLPKLGLRWPGFRKVRGTVCKRLRRRMRALGIDELSGYRARLESDAAEWQEVDALCRIPISRFYRDKALYTALGEDVLPRLAAAALADGRPTLRCWSAGCASGEEPYSLRLVWDLAVASDFPDLACDILASDSDPVMLRRARRAIYSAGSLKELPTGWRDQAFEASDGGFRLREQFRSGITIVQQDIRQAMPDGPFDLILCRNLAFTYFDEETQVTIFEGLDARLRPGGALAIGAHEELPPGAAGYTPLTSALPLFVKGAAAAYLDGN